jgi:hypothetical protein
MRYRTTASPSEALKPSRPTFRICHCGIYKSSEFYKVLQPTNYYKFLLKFFDRSTALALNVDHQKIQTQCIIHYFIIIFLHAHPKKWQNNQCIDGGHILVEVEASLMVLRK